MRRRPAGDRGDIATRPRPTTARRRLLVIGPTPPPYHGVAVQTRMLLDSERLRRDWAVTHLDTTDRRSLHNLGRLDATNVWLALRHASELGRTLLAESPDVVYLPISRNAWAYLRDAVFIGLAKAFGARVVSHLHGSDLRAFYARTSGLCRWLVRRTSAWLDGAAVLGAELRPLYRGLVPDGRVHVAPPGVEDPLAGSPPVSTAAARGDDDAVTMLYLGTLFEPKGFLDLLRAAGRLAAAGSRCRFVIAGPWYSERERTAAAELLDRYELGDVVRFPGVVDGERKHRLLREADMLVFPSYQREGLPLVILEAMAAALPVISTACGAVPDAVVDGGTGLLVPARDPDRLAAAIRGLAGDPDARARMGRAGRERYRERYTERRGAENVARMLEAACAR